MSQPALRLVKHDQARPPTVTELEIAFGEWSLFLEADDYADLTIKHYSWHVAHLLEWLAGRGCASPEQVTEKLLREWAVAIKQDNGWVAATRKQAVTAARNFFAWCWQERLVRDNPAEVLKVPKSKLCPQRTITRTEIDRMVSACDDSLLGLRNAAIVSLLFDSGLRSAEICRLRLSDLNLTERELYVKIKGGATLPGWFGQKTAKRLESWLSVRQAKPGVEAVFVGIGGTTPGASLTPDGLRPILRQLGQQAGVPQVNAHSFRRGFTVALSAAGISDNVLKDLGRWSSTAMIKRYTLAQQVRHLYQSPLDS